MINTMRQIWSLRDTSVVVNEGDNDITQKNDDTTEAMIDETKRRQ